MPIVSAPHGPMTRSLDCTESERDGGLEMEGEMEGERGGGRGGERAEEEAPHASPSTEHDDLDCKPLSAGYNPIKII